jgi:glycosyltransferase involved in cell wall biosynthesis
MRVLAFSNLFPSAANPAFGTFNRETFLALSKYSEIRVVAPTPAWQMLRRPRDIVSPVRESVTGLDATFPPFFSVPGATWLHAGAMAASLFPGMKKLREEFPWDAVVAAWAYPDATAAAVFALRWKTPLVTVALGTDLNVVPGYRGVGRQVRWALSCSARVVTVSRALGDRAIELGARPDRVVVQHNAVDGESFVVRDRAETRRRLGLDEARPTLGYFGHHREIKGTDVLIEAMDHLVHRLGRGDVLLLLIGQGDITDRIRARVAELGLEANIRFLGAKPHAEIPPWMSALDVFCLPSRQEGCPNVVLESLASGRPVVASRVGGVPEILDDRSGVLVPPEDPAALAEGLRSALDRRWDPEALRGNVQFLSWDAVGRRYAEMLREVVNPGSE